MPNKRKTNFRGSKSSGRASRRPKRSVAGSSQRFANRRQLVRITLKSNPTSKDLYLIPLTDLVPLSEPLPETDEQVHKVSVKTTIVTNNNVTGCTIQFGIAGAWAQDESTSVSDFIPLTSPKMLKSTRPTGALIGIPEPTRHIKGVVKERNFLAVQIYPVLPEQVADATLIVETNTTFKLAIKEPLPVMIGSQGTLQPMLTASTSSAPPSNQKNVPYIISVPGSFTPENYTTVDSAFPLHYTGGHGHDHFDITGTGIPFFAGTFVTGSITGSLQGPYTTQGYSGNITYN